MPPPPDVPTCLLWSTYSWQAGYWNLTGMLSFYQGAYSLACDDPIYSRLSVTPVWPFVEYGLYLNGDIPVAGFRKVDDPGVTSQCYTYCDTYLNEDVPVAGSLKVDDPGVTSQCYTYCDTYLNEDVPVAGSRKVDDPGVTSQCYTYCDTYLDEDVLVTGSREVDDPGVPSGAEVHRHSVLVRRRGGRSLVPGGGATVGGGGGGGESLVPRGRCCDVSDQLVALVTRLHRQHDNRVRSERKSSRNVCGEKDTDHNMLRSIHTKRRWERKRKR